MIGRPQRNKLSIPQGRWRSEKKLSLTGSFLSGLCDSSDPEWVKGELAVNLQSFRIRQVQIKL
jgi:hypothetical protein